MRWRLDCGTSVFLWSGFMKFLIQWASIWIIHFARFFGSQGRWRQCWRVNGIAEDGYSFHPASAAGMPTPQRCLNPGIGLASVVSSPWEICGNAGNHRGAKWLFIYISDLTRVCSWVPMPWQKAESFFFFFYFDQSWASRGSIAGRAAICSCRHFVFLSQTSSWCRYLGNKQSICRPNISGLSLSWEQTVCFYSCKHTEDSYLVLPLQLIVI